MTATSEETSNQLALNPLNLCPHGLYDGSGDCDECRAEYEAFEREIDEEQLAADRRFAYRDDPHADEPFFEVAL